MHARTRPGRPLGPVVVRPPRALGAIAGGGLAAWAAAAGIAALSTGIGAPAEPKTLLAWAVGFVLLCVAAAFAYWTYGVATLRYVIDRNTLTVRFGFRAVVIPIDAVQRLVPGRTLEEVPVKGLNWWGCHIGVGELKRIGPAYVYSTHKAPEELLVIVTATDNYALTVLDQAAFAEEIQARADVAPLETHPPRALAWGLAALPFWGDRTMVLSAVGAIAGCLAMVAYLFARYPDLAAVIQVDFPDLGGVVRVGEKGELLKIAYLGAGILGVNLVFGALLHAAERAAGVWLVAAGGMLQLVLLAAAVVAVERA